MCIIIDRKCLFIDTTCNPERKQINGQSLIHNRKYILIQLLK